MPAALCPGRLSERFEVVTAPGQANLVTFVAEGAAAEIAQAVIRQRAKAAEPA